MALLPACCAHHCPDRRGRPCCRPGRGVDAAIRTRAALAAAQAKPIFRSAIEDMTVRGSFDILGEDEAATRYLRKYAYGEIRARLRPLVRIALDRVGAFSRMGQLARSASLPAAAGVS